MMKVYLESDRLRRWKEPVSLMRLLCYEWRHSTSFLPTALDTQFCEIVNFHIFQVNRSRDFVLLATTKGILTALGAFEIDGEELRHLPMLQIQWPCPSLRSPRS